MVCPKCQANVADDSNFCPRCGTPFKKRQGFLATLWRDNKPGFVILSLLLIAMLASIVYYLNSKTGTFEVKIARISDDDAIDFYTKTAFEAYCREFSADCQSGKTDAIENEIKKVIPVILRENAGGYAKITYYNGTKDPITATRFKYRQPQETWRVGNAKDYYRPKIDRLRQVSLRGGRLAFEHKVDLALTLATVEHSVPFTLKSGESKTWCLINETPNRERQIEYAQNGKTYETPILRHNRS